MWSHPACARIAANRLTSPIRNSSRALAAGVLLSGQVIGRAEQRRVCVVRCEGIASRVGYRSSMGQGSRARRRGLFRVALVAAAGVPALVLSRAQAQPPPESESAQPVAAPPTTAPAEAPTQHAEPEAAPTQAPIWIAQPAWNAYPAVPADLPPLPPPPTRREHQHIFLNPGYLLSITPAVASREYTNHDGTHYTDVAMGHGVELSLAIWQPRSLVSFGIFTQMQRYLSFNGDHNRYAFGLQGSWFLFGFETGLAHREADDLRRGTTMVHLAPVISLAFLNIGARIGIPITVGTESHPVHKAELSMVLAVKVPIPLQ